jgi:hypothetical protein
MTTGADLSPPNNVSCPIDAVPASVEIQITGMAM